MEALDLLTRHSQAISLSDARKMGVVDLGDPSGSLLFCCHGWPGSRGGALYFHEAAQRLGVRVVGVDRPGLGLSSPMPKRKLLDFPRDLEELADIWGVERFSVVGVSGGGPYALACASVLSDRLHGVGVVAGMGPYESGVEGMREGNQAVFRLAHKANWLLRFFLWMGVGRKAGQLDALKEIIPKMLDDLPEPDKESFCRPGVIDVAALELQEAFRQGAKWVARDGALYTQPWGFSLASLHNVQLWHGELDRNVPVQMARKIVERAPQIQATFFPEHGHISLLPAAMETILTTLRP